MIELSNSKLQEIVSLLKQKILANPEAKQAFDNASNEEEGLMEGLKICYREASEHKLLLESHEQRIAEILNVIMGLANLDYGQKAKVTGNGDIYDALAAGVNMLGEELKSSTVSLKEKEVLLKEVHHRVKNNLQIISSLLNLQSAGIKDKKSLAKFLDSRERVKAMALIHEMLYEKKDFSKIDFANYLQEMLKNLFNTYSTTEHNVQLELDLQLKHPYLEIDKAIPCGLILNEVVSNCLKYAFPGDKKGVLKISLKDEEGKGKVNYFLQITDNGIGLPPKFDIKTTETLGFQLIYMLSEQMDAALHVKSDDSGTSFLISF